MRNYTHFIIPILLLPFVAACSGTTQAERNRQEAEREGGELLQQARRALRANDYSRARGFVETLRHDYPLAFDARRRGIVLLDSIELAGARDSIRFAEGEEWERLNMKVRFYERKLAEDIKAYGE